MIRRTTSDPDRFEAFTPSPCVQNHAANLMLLANGDLGCVWFGGTQEGMAAISIWFARLAKESSEWSQPVKLSDDPARSKQNPILFPAPDETLWLLWTAQISGNQNTAVVRKRTSSDNGHSWSPVETLFAGSRTFVRQPLVVLDNGDWLLPVFNCPSAPGRRWNGDDDTSSVKISSDGGLTWRDIEVPGSNGCVHMNKAQLADGSLLALFRSRWADNIYESRSNDRGRTWSVPIKTTLHNNFSIQFTRLTNGYLALVFNDSSAANATERRASLYDEIEDDLPSPAPAQAATPPLHTAFWGMPRAPLTLAISADDGYSWTKRNVEIGEGYCMTNNSRDRSNRELSYPSIKQGPDAALHIAFTYHRQVIKYMCA